MPSDALDRLEVVTADITTLPLDAIVNAANDRLAPGGGVCGAIHRAAGPRLAEECTADLAAHGPLSPGEARLTAGHALPARWVVHVLGPVWRGGSHGEDAALAAAYRSSLEVAAKAGARSIGFPAISTGIFGFPPERAAPIALRTAAETASRLPEMARIVFVCFDATSAALHEQALADLGR